MQKLCCIHPELLVFFFLLCVCIMRRLNSVYVWFSILLFTLIYALSVRTLVAWLMIFW